MQLCAPVVSPNAQASKPGNKINNLFPQFITIKILKKCAWASSLVWWQEIEYLKDAVMKLKTVVHKFSASKDALRVRMPMRHFLLDLTTVFNYCDWLIDLIMSEAKQLRNESSIILMPSFIRCCFAMMQSCSHWCTWQVMTPANHGKEILLPMNDGISSNACIIVSLRRMAFECDVPACLELLMFDVC